MIRPPKQKDTSLRGKLVETVAQCLTQKTGIYAGMVGARSRKKAERVVDATLARLASEGCKIVKVKT